MRLLDEYARPLDPTRPVLCVDEGGERLLADVRQPLPLRPGSPAKQGYEHKRAGLANLLPAPEPLAGWRHVELTE